MRTFAMGDIHGAYKALVQCLERSGFDKEKDTLIQLGDVADGWSETFECVEELLKIKNLIAIQGNHDFWTLQWMASGYMIDTHRGQGGQATMNSYHKHQIADFVLTGRDAHLNFFRYQHNYYIDEKNRLFVHGGINRDFPISDGNNTHNFSWNRSLWQKAMSCKGDDKLTTVDGFSEIFIGHTATVNWFKNEEKTESGIVISNERDRITTPMNSGGVWNLDTGAGFKGKLTIMDVETKEYWQSDFCHELYPEETGRRNGYKPKD